jgi:hypothetical protein
MSENVLIMMAHDLRRKIILKYMSSKTIDV